MPINRKMGKDVIHAYSGILLNHKTWNNATWGNMDGPVAAAAKSLQSCLTLCDPIDGSPPGSPVPGILQARTLEWVAISFSNVRKGKAKVKSLSRVQLWATPWTAAHQAPPSMGFSRQEDWSGVPVPSPIDGPRDYQTKWSQKGEDKYHIMPLTYGV